MLETSARRHYLRRVPGAALTLAALVLLATTGCSKDAEKSAPPPTPTPMASLNTTAMEVPRIEFCQLVPDAAVHRALGADADSDSSYGNGDEVALPSDGPSAAPAAGKEIVHEIGCSWSTDKGAEARAWVFARPVDAAFAKTVIASGRHTKGCRTTRGPSYGDPSTSQTCRLPGGAQRVRHAGLFGQTWLTCEVEATDPADVTGLPDRSERWCVEVANALNTGR